MSKKNNHYTIMIVPHSERETVTLRIPVFIVQLLVVFIVVCILIIMVWVKQYFSVLNNYEKVKLARVEVETMQKEYTELVSKVIDMEEQLAKVHELEQQVRLEHGFVPSDEVMMETNLQGTVHQLSMERKIGVTASSILVESAKNEVKILSSGIPTKINSLEDLIVEIHQKNIELAHTPNIWPAVGRLSSKFGYRSDPFTKRQRFHAGIDVANRVNTPIYATADGVVTFSGRDAGYGRKIMINHQNGIETVYAHLNKIIIDQGEEVEKGQLIGYMGSSGRSTGSHLHYEIHLNGTPVDPLDYIEN